MASNEQLPKVIERLRTILAHPHEDLDEEFKGWLDLSDEDDKANLAKAILALANHGGGHVIIGFRRSSGGLAPDTQRPVDLSAYSSDDINNIVKRYAEPRFQCKVDFISHPQTEEQFPIITVPGGHKTPIRAKSETGTRKHVRVNAYYIRRPGPESCEPQTSQEWDDLIKRCLLNSRDDLLSQIRHVIQGFGPKGVEMSVEQAEDGQFREWIEDGKKRFKQWAQGASLSPEALTQASTNYWIGAYRIHKDLGKISPKELLVILARVARQEPGYPYWHVPPSDQSDEPWNQNGIVEFAMKPRHPNGFQEGFPFDFWRASPRGLMLLLRGYEEDFYSTSEQDQKMLRVENPIWDVAACCLHAARLVKALDVKSAPITIGFYWDGLRNRKLIGVKERKYNERICRQQSASANIKCSWQDIDANLAEIVRDLSSDLYQGFSFFEPKIQFIQEQVAELKGLTPRPFGEQP